MPGSMRMQTSEARIPQRVLHPSERRTGYPQRAASDGAWAAPTYAMGNFQRVGTAKVEARVGPETGSPMGETLRIGPCAGYRRG
jgi:hypothetical protein